MDLPVIIFGAKGMGVAALEIFESHDIIVYGFLDDDESLHGTEINTVPVLGSTEDDGYLKLIGKKCEAFVAVDDNELRKGITDMLLERRKKMPINAHHAYAMISQSVHLGHGNFINSGSVLGASTKIGNHCIINSSATIDYEVELGDFVQIGAGAVINSRAKVESGAFIGSGATIVSGVTIGEGARVGAGSVVIQEVKPGETVFGNPAQAIKA